MFWQQRAASLIAESLFEPTWHEERTWPFSAQDEDATRFILLISMAISLGRVLLSRILSFRIAIASWVLHCLRKACYWIPAINVRVREE
jgi:hypothetical protein